ncbi:MAG: hypothetical protein IJO38_08255 [Akkermansia sp.]|nr:hypothetical protein [Akkermansia sp.]
MFKMLVPILMAGTALYAAETEPMAAVCDQLLAALEQETASLTKMQAADDVPAALEELRDSLQKLEALMAVDAKELWTYIDNTTGAKQPLVDELERLALQFARVQKAAFFNNAELKSLLAPQVLEQPKTHRSKREKLHEIDHDE